MSEELASALEDVAKRFREPEGKDKARFGHLALPKTHLAREDFLARFLEAFGRYQNEDDYRIFIVVSEFEKHRAETDHAGLFSDPSAPAEPSDLRPILLTFRELITILESNRAGSSNGEKGWKAASQPEGWNTDKVLPNRVVVYFNIQPCLPASCALTLLGLMKWALDVSERPLTALGILTASDSSDIDKPIVSRLVGLYGSRQLESFDISHLQPRASKPTLSVCGEDSAMELIGESIVDAEPNSTHAVLFFSLQSPANQLDHDLEAKGVGHEVVFLSSRGLVPDMPHVRKHFRHDQLGHSRYNEEPQARIIILDPEQRPLAFLQGYTHAHIILGSPTVEKSFDREARQIASTPIHLSRDMRQSQIALSHQPHVESVHVYASSGLQELSRTGTRHFRLIENEEAGGFIAAVFAMSSWGLNPTDVMACFQLDSQVYLEMRHRMVTQKIIKANPFALALTGQTAAIFQTMLPIVKYDHRIAYFLAIPASTPLVLHVKIQLAAILMIGIETLFLIEEDPSLDELLGSCWGYGRCLAPTGTLWLLLGLWKRLVVDDQEAEGHSGIDRCTAEGRVRSTVTELDAFKRNTRQIRKALAHFGLQLSSGDIVLEDGDLWSDQCMELQYHLLLAYVHQLVVTVPAAGGETQLRHTIVSTDAEVAGLGCPNIPHLFDIEEVMAKEGGRLTYSICKGFARTRNHNFHVLHWTGIPLELVTFWKLNHAPNKIYIII